MAREGTFHVVCVNFVALSSQCECSFHWNIGFTSIINISRSFICMRIMSIKHYLQALQYNDIHYIYGCAHTHSGIHYFLELLIRISRADWFLSTRGNLNWPCGLPLHSTVFASSKAPSFVCKKGVYHYSYM